MISCRINDRQDCLVSVSCQTLKLNSVSSLHRYSVNRGGCTLYVQVLNSQCVDTRDRLGAINNQCLGGISCTSRSDIQVVEFSTSCGNCSTSQLETSEVSGTINDSSVSCIAVTLILINVSLYCSDGSVSIRFILINVSLYCSNGCISIRFILIYISLNGVQLSLDVAGNTINKVQLSKGSSQCCTAVAQCGVVVKLNITIKLSGEPRSGINNNVVTKVNVRTTQSVLDLSQVRSKLSDSSSS